MHSVGIGEELKTISALLNRWDLNAQQGCFKLCMKLDYDVAMTPPYYANPLTYLWKTITKIQLLCHSFPEFVKLAKIAMVYVVGNVLNE